MKELSEILAEIVLALVGKATLKAVTISKSNLPLQILHFLLFTRALCSPFTIS
jgi:hypothetical protein